MLISEHKQRDIVNRFLAGQSCTDISAHHAMTRTTAEEVVRRALRVALTLLNQAPQSTEPKPEAFPVAPDGTLTVQNPVEARVPRQLE